MIVFVRGKDRRTVTDFLKTNSTLLKKEILNTIKKFGGIRSPLSIALIQFMVHKSCDMDRLTSCEFVFRKLSKIQTRCVVQSKQGRNGYTPLCRAAYHGSKNLLKYLISCGASIDETNIHGETLLDILQIGMEDKVKQYPEDSIFITNRYGNCARFVRWYSEKIKNTQAACKIQKFFLQTVRSFVEK